MTGGRREAGFTMIEVMVAVLLTALAVIGVIALFRIETRASGSSRHETEAAVLAQDKLEVLRTQAAPTGASTPAPETGLDALGNTGGIFDRSWVISASGDVYDIVVTVAWDENGDPRQVIVRGRR